MYASVQLWACPCSVSILPQDVAVGMEIMGSGLWNTRSSEVHGGWWDRDRDGSNDGTLGQSGCGRGRYLGSEQLSFLLRMFLLLARQLRLFFFGSK